MSTLFAFQLIASFIIGGSMISLLSFLAERAPKNIAGILLAFPTTGAVGFFFLGWALSPVAAAKTIPSALIALGVAIIFTVVYSYTALSSQAVTHNKILQIILSLAISLGAWLLLASLLFHFKVENFAFALSAYILLAITAHFLLKRKHFDKIPGMIYTPWQKIWRAIFIGTVVLLAILLGKLLNPFWGSILALFPAAFASMMVILHWHYKPENLFPTIQKAPVGTLSLAAYLITVMLTFPTYGFVLGTLISYLVSLLVTLILLRFARTRINS